jgi:two-component system, HptB-dependent secretion and biofilm response regulator
MGSSGEEILLEINAQLYERLPIGIFFAATLVEIMPEHNRALLWNSALPDSLLIRNGKIHKRFSSGLVPLGVMSKINLTTACNTLELEEGDRLFTFSDGIVEAKGKEQEMFGMERLEVFLEKVDTEELPLDDLMILLDEYVGATTHEDDITLVETQF